MAQCPECLSEELAAYAYDFGICPETGYRDAGERFRCRSCGATGLVEDVVLDLDTAAKRPAALEREPGTDPFQRLHSLPDDGTPATRRNAARRRRKPKRCRALNANCLKS